MQNSLFSSSQFFPRIKKRGEIPAIEYIPATNYLAIDGVVTNPATYFTAMHGGLKFNSVALLNELFQNGFVLDIEYKAPLDATLSANQTFFSTVRKPSNISRFEINHDGVGTFGGAQSVLYSTMILPTPTFTASNVPNYMGGVNRILRSFGQGEFLINCQNNELSQRSSTLTYNYQSFTDAAINYRILGNDQPVINSRLIAFRIWRGFKNQTALEFMADNPPNGRKPLLITGSSIWNKQTFALGGGLLAQTIKNEETYFPIRLDNVGGTSPLQQAARYLAMPDRYHSYNLLSGEIGLDGDIGDYLVALSNYQTKLRGKLFLIEPEISTFQIAGSPSRTIVDGVRNYFRANYSDILIKTFEGAQALDPLDPSVVDHDTWPSSIFTDGIHLNNTTGTPGIGAVIRARLFQLAFNV